MMNGKSQRNNRGGRVNFGGNRPDKRPPYQNQDRHRVRNQMNYNEKNVTNDGPKNNIYKNQRLTHTIFSLLDQLQPDAGEAFVSGWPTTGVTNNKYSFLHTEGYTVQIQVKSGVIYEGVLVTFSDSGDAVLEFARKIGGDLIAVPNNITPDGVIEKLVIKVGDLVTMNVTNVDLDYAVKDSFTDNSISKYNGEARDKEMRQLQPWESEGGDEITLEVEGDKSSNGWDATEMFHTNATQFNVKTSYDESLEQYTTKLPKGNTEEYRKREEEAHRLAAEIEGCDQYRQHVDVENGDGDDEAAFSAVVRPNESGASGSGKHVQDKEKGWFTNTRYVPPYKRTTGSGNMQKQPRGGYVQSSLSRSNSNQQQAPSSSSVTETVNGDEQGRLGVTGSMAGPTVKTSPSHEHATNAPHDNKQEHPSHLKKSQKGRDEQIKELKEFSSKFKLDGNTDPTKEKDKDTNVDYEIKCSSDYIQTKDSVSKDRSHNHVDSPENVLVKQDNTVRKPVQDMNGGAVMEERHSENKYTQSPSAAAEQLGESQQESSSDLAAHSKLNPNAKVFNPKTFQQQTPQQIPTPPHPQTNSPSLPQHLMMNMHPQPVFPGPGQQFMPAPAMVLNSNAPQPPKQYSVMPKRAVVSVMRPEYAAQSAVQAATGQPLLAQNTPPAGIMYYQSMMQPQPTGYQLGQIMPMPPPLGQRFITPTSMQGIASSSMHAGGAGLDQNSPAGQLYLTNQQGQMAAHLSQASHFGAHPGHLMHTMPNSSNSQQPSSQMSQPLPASGSGGHHHPAPSPVHTQSMNQQQPMNPGAHPQPSGTPQPHPAYSQALASSPHNPTSPHNMPMYPYPSIGHPSMQLQGSNGGQQFSMPQHSSIPTSVSYSINPLAHHSPHIPHHVYMMPPHPSASGPMTPHIHSTHQFPGHPMVGPGPMQPQMMTQTGVQGVPGPNHGGQGPHPHQMQFIPQVHNAGGQHVTSYQPSQ